nr:otu domain-containing protein 2 [Quercus suber]
MVHATAAPSVSRKIARIRYRKLAPSPTITNRYPAERWTGTAGRNEISSASLAGLLPFDSTHLLRRFMIHSPVNEVETDVAFEFTRLAPVTSYYCSSCSHPSFQSANPGLVAIEPDNQKRSLMMEELHARHRKEQRDLQSRVTQKKKQASKKTRKGVNEECERLETELRERQHAEIVAAEGRGKDVDADLVPDVEDLTLEIDEPAHTIQESDGMVHISEPVAASAGTEDTSDSAQTRKPNRQKARLARRAAELEEQSRKAAEEAENLPDLKEQERERMLEAMKTRGLREKEIRADGHCLYSAIADQLEQLDIPLTNAPDQNPSIAYKTVRAAAAEYIEGHPDDFAPFLEEPLPEYVCKVRDTGEWGGQLELMALAKRYGIEINVLQDFGRVEKIEGSQAADVNSKRSVWVGYYKHGFGLGEHYNSLRKLG